MQWDPAERAETLVGSTHADIRHGGDSAFYHPGDDFIRVPHRAAFSDGHGYYATLLHELAHWTGNGRVPRNLKSRFGSAPYAREELRAEMASAMLCAGIGISDDVSRAAAYVADWVRVLQEDKYEIFRASSDAQKISDFLMAYADASDAEAAG